MERYLGHIEICLHYQERIDGICLQSIWIVKKILGLSKGCLVETWAPIFLECVSLTHWFQTQWLWDITQDSQYLTIQQLELFETCCCILPLRR